MRPGYTNDNILDDPQLTDTNIINSITADLANLGVTFVSIEANEVCPPGTYKVALVLDPGIDYHWYRQNPDGTWSHKQGQLMVKNIDASGNVIYDPYTADRDYTDICQTNYDVFLGFFYVTPLNYLATTNNLVFEYINIDTIRNDSILSDISS